jgi:hypothetical protein
LSFGADFGGVGCVRESLFPLSAFWFMHFVDPIVEEVYVGDTA